MISFRILSIILGLAVSSQALPSVLHSYVSTKHALTAATATTADGVPIKDFLLTRFDGSFVALNVTGSFQRSLSFAFEDQNSRTSTTCNATWIDTTTSSNPPYGPSYTLCTKTNGTAKPEYFQWHIDTYTNFTSFSLELAHEFSDPKNYPPPYDYVEYFAPVNVTLKCADEASSTACKLADHKTRLHAIVNAISN